jgi:hypothetical protein
MTTDEHWENFRIFNARYHARRQGFRVRQLIRAYENGQGGFRIDDGTSKKILAGQGFDLTLDEVERLVGSWYTG